MALTLTCPVCGSRDGHEFCFGGEDKGPRPDDATLSAESWCDYAHMNRSLAGIQREWWHHRDGCGTWFVTHRDTVRNREMKILLTDTVEQSHEREITAAHHKGRPEEKSDRQLPWRTVSGF